MRLLFPVLLAACSADDAPRSAPTEPTALTSLPSGTPSGTPTGTATGPTEPWTLPAPTWAVEGLWSQHASPRVIDLDGDGVLDVVTGHGTESGVPGGTGLIRASDGATGEPLWELPTRQEIVGSACFVDVGGSAAPDVVIGGRHAELLAVDGALGMPLWTWPMDVDTGRAAGWYNFYSAQRLDDLDGDGISEVLVANGGDSRAGPLEVRPPGRLAVLSGVDGALVADAHTPDGAETYLSPVLQGDGLLFGTGGETWPGGLWRASIADLLAGDLDSSELWVDGAPHGAIGPPALGDLDGDGVLDAVVAMYGGSLVALDGATGSELWRIDNPGHETHAMPGLGHFDHDGRPDVFVSLTEGTFPVFSSVTHLAVDGASGAEVWREEIGLYASSGPVLADLDGDGLDEVIFTVNDPGLSPDIQGQLWLFDPVARAARPLAEPDERGMIASPWVGDLDGDGDLELVVGTTEVLGDTTWGLIRYDLEAQAPLRISWGGYLGTDGDSQFR